MNELKKLDYRLHIFKSSSMKYKTILQLKCWYFWTEFSRKKNKRMPEKIILNYLLLENGLFINLLLSDSDRLISNILKIKISVLDYFSESSNLLRIFCTRVQV